MQRLAGVAEKLGAWCCAGALAAGLFGCGGRSQQPGDEAAGSAAAGKGTTDDSGVSSGNGAVGGGGTAAGSGAAGSGPSGGSFASSGGASAGTFSTAGNADPASSGGPTFGGAASAGNGGGGAGGIGGAPATGCGVSLSGGVPVNVQLREVDIAGLDPVYLPGGAYYQSSGGYDFSHRPYAVKLPSNYDSGRPSPIHVSVGGCGGTAELFAKTPPSPAFVAPDHGTIEVVLSYIDGCVADGGPKIGNRDDTPDLPYLRAVLADVGTTFCADVATTTLSGYASGAWEAQTLGCAAGDVIRGVATVGGGLRAARPACKGPMPTLFVAHTNDSASPLGPLEPTDPAYIQHGGPGLVPSRDEVLARNGCQGTNTALWNADYPACVTYTGCPAAYPVVWCEIGGVMQTLDYYNGVSYFNKDVWTFFSSLP